MTNKPKGMTVFAGKGSPSNTLQNVVAANILTLLTGSCVMAKRVCMTIILVGNLPETMAYPSLSCIHFLSIGRGDYLMKTFLTSLQSMPRGCKK